jgi:hypothetical protein
LTRLDAVAAAYGSLDLNGLRSLMAAGVDIRHLDGLHAKVFLTDSAAFAGSANLTAAGLGTARRANAELSVLLDDMQRRQAEKVFAQWWGRASQVRESDIDECERIAAAIPTRISRPPRLPRARRVRADTADQLLCRASEVGTWIKAVYRGEESYPWAADWVSTSVKGKPAFRTGDLLVVYAVYAKRCFTVLRVTGDTTFDVQGQVDGGVPQADAQRWPWVTDVEVMLEVPPPQGAPLQRMGITGLSLRNGHCRMPVGGLAAALGVMTS